MKKGIDCRGKNWEENSNKLKNKDLTGQRFNKLLVLFRVQNDKKNNSQWLCKCDCGKQVIVHGSSLRSGHTTSCGCAQKENVSKKLSTQFFSGQRVGRWTIMYQSQNHFGKGAYWHCKCDCGMERDVSSNHLKKKESLSCGCARNETNTKKNLIDLTGKQFGLLTVVKRSNKKVDGDVYWNYKCNCGRTGIISGHNLRRGSAISCGCLNVSHGEYFIMNILNNNKIDYIYDRIYFKDLKTENGNFLRYDFILLKENIPFRIIEFDGIQHHESVALFGGDKAFKKTQENDKIKNQYAFSHNIPLVRIPYTEKNNITFEMLMGDKYLLTRPKK